MKSPIFLCLLSATIISFCFHPAFGRAEDWVVRRSQTSGACAVQLNTASPLGVTIAGPFATRKEACQKASDLYDDSMTAPDRCWAYIPQSIDWCKSEGITLPPQASRKKTGKSATAASSQR